MITSSEVEQLLGQIVKAKKKDKSRAEEKKKSLLSQLSELPRGQSIHLSVNINSPAGKLLKSLAEEEDFPEEIYFFVKGQQEALKKRKTAKAA
ncbi:MAG: hypothetical protein OXR68_01485 [Alphaproteobacteria bacterium]|nr:hypothetical protein [Alphaproteobacteria bacterium]MDD9919284.1 hypothetical protein [Alphaproteobacteria bacterium]